MPKGTTTKRATVYASELAILAGSVGLVENTEDGRKAFSAWLACDQKAARAALFKRVAARRAAASAARGRGGQQQAASARQYPTGWLRAAGKGTRRGKGVRITEGSD